MPMNDNDAWWDDYIEGTAFDDSVHNGVMEHADDLWMRYPHDQELLEWVNNHASLTEADYNAIMLRLRKNFVSGFMYGFNLRMTKGEGNEKE